MTGQLSEVLGLGDTIIENSALKVSVMLLMKRYEQLAAGRCEMKLQGTETGQHRIKKDHEKTTADPWGILV